MALFDTTYPCALGKRHRLVLVAGWPAGGCTTTRCRGGDGGCRRQGNGPKARRPERQLHCSRGMTKEPTRGRAAETRLCNRTPISFRPGSLAASSGRVFLHVALQSCHVAPPVTILSWICCKEKRGGVCWILPYHVTAVHPRPICGITGGSIPHIGRGSAGIGKRRLARNLEVESYNFLKTSLEVSEPSPSILGSSDEAMTRKDGEWMR